MQICKALFHYNYPFEIISQIVAHLSADLSTIFSLHQTPTDSPKLRHEKGLKIEYLHLIIEEYQCSGTCEYCLCSFCLEKVNSRYVRSCFGYVIRHLNLLSIKTKDRDKVIYSIMKLYMGFIIWKTL